jgi:hypothetical protein
MNTLLLDRTTSDLVLDISGNIAVASDPYSVAQDAASQIKLISGELWYDQTQGVPYFSRIFGKTPNVPYIKSTLIAQALSVPNATAAQCFITSISNRNVSGQVQITDSAGQTSAVPIAPAPTVSPVVQSSSASLDFSNPSNSQFLPGL